MEQGNERIYSAAVGRFVSVNPRARKHYDELLGADHVKKEESFRDYVKNSIDTLVVDTFCRKGAVSEDDWSQIKEQLENDLSSRYNGEINSSAKNFLYGRLEHMQALFAIVPYSKIAQEEIREKRKIPYDILE